MPGDNRKTIGKSTGAIRSAPAKQETPTRTNTGNLQRKARAAPLDTPRFASFVRQDVAVVIEGERDPLFEPFIAGQFIRAQRDKAPEVPPRFIEPAEFAAVQAAGHLIRRDMYLQFFTVHTGAKAIVHQKIQLPETDRFGIGGVFVRERLLLRFAKKSLYVIIYRVLDGNHSCIDPVLISRIIYTRRIFNPGRVSTAPGNRLHTRYREKIGPKNAGMPRTTPVYASQKTGKPANINALSSGQFYCHFVKYNHKNRFLQFYRSFFRPLDG